MMKIALNKPVRDEKGQAMILVIILLLVGSLIIAPLMGFMSTGILAGQTLEERMDELYAADAGIEDALHKMVNGDALLPGTVDDTWTPPSIVVNGKDVTVEIVLEENLESFLEGLLDGDAGPHDDWAASSGAPTGNIYTITIDYTGNSANKWLNGVGAWLQGDYDIARDAFDDPIFSGMTDDYPNYTFEVRSYGGGTAFIWEWNSPPDKPVFGTNPGVFTMSLTFEFTPDDDPPDLYFSWLVGISNDIGVVAEDIVIEVWKVTATATDLTTDKKTKVIAYVSREGEEEPYTVGIFTWDISLE